MNTDTVPDPSGYLQTTHDVVMRYHLAWKRCDPDAIVSLYHPDVSYYDFLQNRIFHFDELADYVRASLPHGDTNRIEHTDRIRIDGDTAFIQYRVMLSGSDGPAAFCTSEAITVRDGQVWQVREYATLQRGEPGEIRSGDARSPLQRLGLSARQLSRMAEDLHSYFTQQQPYLDPDCTLLRVAQATGYSRNQISYLLNQVLGVSFYRYLNQARLRNLLGRLERETAVARIDQLAFSAGFNSLSAFYRCFRAETGLSPVAYLRAHACGSARTTAPGMPD
jgi:AraC-like DNA-binding protein